MNEPIMLKVIKSHNKIHNMKNAFQSNKEEHNNAHRDPFSNDDSISSNKRMDGFCQFRLLGNSHNEKTR